MTPFCDPLDDFLRYPRYGDGNNGNAKGIEMNDLNDLIRSLDYEYGMWEEEYQAHGPHGTKRSSMSKRDLNFLKRKIDAVHAMKAKVETFMQDVRDSVQSHKANF